MTNCSDRFRELTHTQDIVLDEDLAGLQRMQDRSRIERYNNLKADEEEFRWEFSKDCPDFLTSEETGRVRGRFKLARLMLVASFYADGEVPRSIEDEFIEAELQAVVDFERYKQFDALSEKQIQEKIRRMEGEVYELVQEYTSTQIANMDQMLENSEVQQDVMERLLERYDDRREKVRQGFFTYVETHGLEHMVEAIEDAVKAVNDAAEERERIREEMHAEFQDLSETINDRLRTQQHELESQVRSVEGRLASKTVSSEELRAEMESLQAQTGEFSEAQTQALSELNNQIERTAEMETRLDAKIGELEQAREQAVNDEQARATEEVTELIQSELSELESERDELRREIENLQREREQIESARDRLDEQQSTLESRVEELETSVPTEEEAREGFPGEDVVTASIARLLELDYLGRFDISMQDVRSIHTPDGAFDVVDGYWDGRSERRSDRPQLIDQLDEDDDPEQYPSNQRARYEITRPRYLGLGQDRRMVIESVVHSHLDAYATNGFDARPADLDDLLDLINEAVYEAEEGEYTHLLAIASPTGWTDRVKQQIENDGIARTRYSQFVSICLVDLQEQSLIYDESDPVVRENVDLFEAPIDTERIEACVQFLQDDYVGNPAKQSVAVDDIVDTEGFDAHVVKHAFDRLDRQGLGEQLYVSDVGLAFHFE